MVMLEKKMGVVLIPKLRAILLKEADNNFHDGEMFGGRMLEHVRSIGFKAPSALGISTATPSQV